MNVFILCAGRSGSLSFIEACKHIDNFTCDHESRAGSVGDDRLAFPERHIEADNRLSWYLGRLHFKYGNEAFYVHLKRDQNAIAKSFSRRKHIGLMNAFASGLLRQKVLSEDALDPESLARDICETATANISHFLIDKPNKMVIQIESVESFFDEFWSRIGATGDKKKAFEALTERVNTSADFALRKAQLPLVSRLKRSIKIAYKTFREPVRDFSVFDR